MRAIIEAQALDALGVDVSAKLFNRPMRVATDNTKEESQLSVLGGVLTYERRIYIPAVDSLRGKVISLFHDNSESRHFGALRTSELVSRDIYWPVLDSRVNKYVSGCKVCHRMKAPRHGWHAINMPLEAPSQAWEGVTMEFITDLPESTALGYTGILVILN